MGGVEDEVSYQPRRQLPDRLRPHAGVWNLRLRDLRRARYGAPQLLTTILRTSKAWAERRYGRDISTRSVPVPRG